MELLEVHKTALTSFTRKKKTRPAWIVFIHLYTNVVVHAIFNTSQWKKRSQKENPNAQGTGQVSCSTQWDDHTTHVSCSNILQ